MLQVESDASCMVGMEEEGVNGAGPEELVLLPAGASIGALADDSLWRRRVEGGSSLPCCVVTSSAWVLLSATCSVTAERT